MAHITMLGTTTYDSDVFKAAFSAALEAATSEVKRMPDNRQTLYLQQVARQKQQQQAQQARQQAAYTQQRQQQQAQHLAAMTRIAKTAARAERVAHELRNVAISVDPAFDLVARTEQIARNLAAAARKRGY